MYVLQPDHVRELIAICEAPGTEIPVPNSRNLVGLAASLGLLSCKVQKKTGVRIGILSLATDLYDLLRSIPEKELASTGERLEKAERQMALCLRIYGMLPMEKMWELLQGRDGIPSDLSEFKRFLFWHDRFLNMVQTSSLLDAPYSDYIALPTVPMELVYRQQKDYGADLEDYRSFPGTPEAMSELLGESLFAANSLAGLLISWGIFEEGKRDDLSASLSAGAVAGCSPSDLDELLPENFEVPDLPGEISYWGCLTALCLKSPAAPLKGYSRLEYAEKKGQKPVFAAHRRVLQK